MWLTRPRPYQLVMSCIARVTEETACISSIRDGSRLPPRTDSKRRRNKETFLAENGVKKEVGIFFLENLFFFSQTYFMFTGCRNEI